LEERLINLQTKYEELLEQFTKRQELLKELGKTLSSQTNKRICEVHSQATHASRLLDFPNLPPPQNNHSRQ
jgi:hypothetical protein